MGLRRTRSAPTWSLLLFAACAASSAASLPRAVTIAPGERIRVELADRTSQRTFALQNVSSGPRSNVYGGADSLLKVVDDQELQRLLDVLAAQGMFDHAGPAADPGSKAAIVVETPQRRYVWSRPQPIPANYDALQQFEAGRGYVLALYNSETAYHGGTLENFAPKTRADIENKSAEARGHRDQGPPK
jgi:hypothetical protein